MKSYFKNVFKSQNFVPTPQEIPFVCLVSKQNNNMNTPYRLDCNKIVQRGTINLGLV